MANRLAYLSEKHNILYPDQIGGRRQRSAIDAALSLVHDIEIAKSNRLKTSVLFLDVKGAFDNVSKVRLIKTLKDIGIPTQLISWIDCFISNRLIKLAFDGKTEILKPVETGIPQGSPISPILFLLYLTPLFNELKLKHTSINCPSYIDDIGLVATNRSERLNIIELERAAETAFKWAAENAVAFDDIKLELIHFNSNGEGNKLEITLPNNIKIKPSNNIRWLGVYFDGKLKFQTHVKTKMAAANRIFNYISNLANLEKGLSSKALI